GIGGRGDGTFDFMHDSKGITIWQPVERKLSWSQAVDYLSEAVAKDKLKYEEWKSHPENIDYAHARWQEELSSEKEQQTEISLFDYENTLLEIDRLSCGIEKSKALKINLILKKRNTLKN
ncbi:hypothetical protein CON87_32265, partial [Bacillus cereus]